MAMPLVTVYTRQGCHLCEQAAELLVESGLRPVLVDVDATPELQARYGTCVPVVVVEGRERFRGRIDRRLLARLLRATAKAPGQGQPGPPGRIPDTRARPEVKR